MRKLPMILMLVSLQAVGQGTDPAKCADLEVYGQLDFWLGEWNVYAGEDLAGNG